MQFFNGRGRLCAVELDASNLEALETDRKVEKEYGGKSFCLIRLKRERGLRVSYIPSSAASWQESDKIKIYLGRESYKELRRGEIINERNIYIYRRGIN